MNEIQRRIELLKGMKIDQYCPKCQANTNMEVEWAGEGEVRYKCQCGLSMINYWDEFKEKWIDSAN